MFDQELSIQQSTESTTGCWVKRVQDFGGHFRWGVNVSRWEGHKLKIHLHTINFKVNQGNQGITNDSASSHLGVAFQLRSKSGNELGLLQPKGRNKEKINIAVSSLGLKTRGANDMKCSLSSTCKNETI
jgi:hypothetical protein